MTVAAPLSRQPGVMAGNIACTASMLIWAAGLAAGDLLIPHVPPLILSLARTGTAALVLLPLWWLVEGFAPCRNTAWGRAMFVGGICIGLGALLLIVAQTMTDAVTVAIVSATTRSSASRWNVCWTGGG